MVSCGMTLFHLTRPAVPGIPVIANIPHSGEEIPRAISWQFRRELRHKLYGTDWHLGRLYDFLPDLGVTVLRATHSRYVVDLNRDWKKEVFGHFTQAVIYRQTFGGDLLYDIEPPDHDLNDRIIRYYLPYHRQLTELLEETVQKHGRAVLLDLHSFGTDSPDVDIVLGDVNGKSCDKRLTESFQQAFKAHGFSVARNDRWTGGHITRHYGGLPEVQALQIEIRFRAYLEQAEIRPVEIEETTETFRKTRVRLREVFREVLGEIT